MKYLNQICSTITNHWEDAHEGKSSKELSDLALHCARDDLLDPIQAGAASRWRWLCWLLLLRLVQALDITSLLRGDVRALLNRV